MSVKRRFALVSLIAASACAGKPVAKPPLVRRAPAIAEGRRISISARVAVDHYWARKGIDRELERAIVLEGKRALSGAGYDAVDDDAELSICVTASVTGNVEEVRSTTHADLALEGQRIARLEVHLPSGPRVVGAKQYAGYVAAALVNALSVSSVWSSVPVPEPATRRSHRRAAEARDAPIVAVFDIADASGRTDSALLEQLTQYVKILASQELGYRVVPTEHLRRELLERKLASHRACIDVECQIELGKAVAAQKVVALELIGIGGQCVLASTVYDLETESAERSTSLETACGATDLLASTKELVARMKTSRVEPPVRPRRNASPP